MPFFPLRFDRMLMRITQGISLAIICLFVTLVMVLLVASRQLGRIQQRLVPIIIQQLRQTLGRDVRIGSLRVDGFDSIRMNDVTVAKGVTFADGAAIEMPRTEVHVNLLALILHGGQHPVDAIRQVVLTQPVAEVARDADGRWDFQDVLERINRTQSTEQLQAQVIVQQGAVTYRDAQGLGAHPTPLLQRLVGIDARVTPQGGTCYQFAVAADDATHQFGRVRMSGNYARAAGAADVQVSANRVAIKELTQYLPEHLPITFENGTAAIRLSALFRNLLSPTTAHALPTTALTAVVDLQGIGLHLDTMSAPIMATAGKLRLVHDPARYPNGSRLDFIGVRAQAGQLPLQISGDIGDMNLLDLPHLDPVFNVKVTAATPDGMVIDQLFPDSPWLQKLHLTGPLSFNATVIGHHHNLRIAGVFNSQQFSLAGLQGEDVSTHFLLQPNGSRVQQPTVQATATLSRAQWNGTYFSHLAIVGSSQTPWRRLATSLLLNGNIQADDVRLPWMNASMVVSDFSATRDHVTLAHINTNIFGGHVTGTAYFPIFAKGLPDPPLQATANYHGVDLGQVGKALQLNGLHGSGNGTLHLLLNANSSVALDTDITGTHLAYKSYHATTARSHIHALVQNGALTVTIAHATAQTDHGSFSVSDGMYTRDTGAADGGTLHLPVQGTQLPLERFTDQLHGFATLQGLLDGRISAPRFTATVSADNGSIAERGDFLHASGDVSYQANALHVSNIVLARHGLEVRIPGVFDPRQGLITAGVTGSVTANGASLQDVLEFLHVVNPVKVDGGISGTATFACTPDGIIASGTASISAATVHIPNGPGGYPLYPLALDHLSMQFDYAKRFMTIRQLTAQRGGATINISGTAGCNINEPLQLQLNFAGAHAALADLPRDLLRIPVPLTGAADLHGTVIGVLNGSGAAPLTVHVAANASQLGVDGLPLGNSDIDLSYRFHQGTHELVMNHVQVANAAFHATTCGDYLLSARRMSGVQLHLTQIDLAALKSLLATIPQGSPLDNIGALADAVQTPIAGHGQADITLDGGYQQPRASLGLDLNHLALNNTPLPDIRANLATEMVDGRYGLRISEAVAQGGDGVGQASISGLITPGGAWNLRFAAQDITPGMLSSWVSGLPVNGRLSLNGSLSGAWKHPLLDSDLVVDHPVIAGHALQRIQAHVQATREQLTISNGEVQASADSQPLTIAGSIPLQWDGQRFHFPTTRAIALSVILPRQNLSLLRGVLPALPDIQGSVAGQLQIGGALSAPEITAGQLALSGSATLPKMDSGYPNQVSNIDLRLHIADSGARETMSIDHLTMELERMEHGVRPQGFQPGWISAAGSVQLAPRDLLAPARWQWDLYAQAQQLPLAPDMFLVPQLSGYLHLTSASGAPRLNGVLFTDNVKVKTPKMPTFTTAAWGPFGVNPQLSLVLQVGANVKLEKSIVRLPLQATPLPWPQMATVTPGTTPALAIDTRNAAYQYNAGMLNAGTSAEMPGTWGVITGSLEKPQVYARFEVNKKKLTFPFSLVGAVRTARGHITYSMSAGPRLTMGIPDFRVSSF